MAILAVNQTTKVAMEVRTRQQKEFLWTTGLAMLEKTAVDSGVPKGSCSFC